MTKQCRKKPVVIEAVQLCWRNWNDVCDFLGDIVGPDNPARDSWSVSNTCGEDAPYIELTIPTLEGDHIAKHGDWLIKGVQGEFYPCKPDIFEATYEPALTSATPPDVAGLVERLESAATDWRDLKDDENAALVEEAATARIEALEAENVRLRLAIWRLSGSGMSFVGFWRAYGDKLDNITKTEVARVERRAREGVNADG